MRNIRAILLFVSLLLLLPSIMAVDLHEYSLSLNPDLYEDEYGENIVTIQREAMILWTRENRKILFDFFDKKNHYVSKLSDEDITNIYRNEESRERSGIDQVDLEPYMARVRVIRNMTNVTLVKVTETASDRDYTITVPKRPVLEEPTKLVRKFTVKPKIREAYIEVPGQTCVQRSFLTSFNPFWRTNSLMKIFKRESVFLPSCN